MLCSSHSSAAFCPCLRQKVQAQGLSESTFQFHHFVPSGRSEPWPTQLQESIRGWRDPLWPGRRGRRQVGADVSASNARQGPLA